MNQNLAQKELNWDNSKKHILFASNPNRIEKNFILTQEAFNLLHQKDLELHYLKDVANEQMPYYYNASDVVILTSLWEGSPNVVKEAMACNRPIVSTDVGDVKKIIKNIEGCYIVNYNADEISKFIQKSLMFMETNGRKNVEYLDEKNISKEIINIYYDLIEENKCN